MRLRRALDRLYDLSGGLAAASLASIGVVMLAQALGREVGVLFRGADDIAAWLCAAAAFLGLAHTFRHGELVRVALWVGLLKGRARWIAEVFALVLTAAFVAYAAWAVSRFVYQSWQMNEINQGLLQVPVWIPQLTLVVGMGIFLVAVVDELVVVLRGDKPAYQRAEEERIARGDFSEAI